MSDICQRGASSIRSITGCCVRSEWSHGRFPGIICIGNSWESDFPLTVCTTDMYCCPSPTGDCGVSGVNRPFDCGHCAFSAEGKQTESVANQQDICGRKVKGSATHSVPVRYGAKHSRESDLRGLQPCNQPNLECSIIVSSRLDVLYQII